MVGIFWGFFRILRKHSYLSQFKESQILTAYLSFRLMGKFHELTIFVKKSRKTL